MIDDIVLIKFIQRLQLETLSPGVDRDLNNGPDRAGIALIPAGTGTKYPGWDRDKGYPDRDWDFFPSLQVFCFLGPVN